jgi:photosystem II stability/assembly factor-like uncharacterized protein
LTAARLVESDSMALPTDSGVTAFYREYAQTGIHAATTAALTALGLLTFVHWGFALAAIAAYLLPPAYLYLGGDAPTRAGAPETSAGTTTDANAGAAANAGTDTDDDAQSGAGDSPRGRPTSRSGATTGEEPSTSPGGPDAGVDPAGEAPEADPDDVDDDAERRWRPADVSTDAALADAVVADGRAYVVGAGGVVLAGPGTDAADGDGEWTRLLDDGPAATGAALTGVDATDDGGAVWVAGDGGALGRHDPREGRVTDLSAPADRTDNWRAVAVGGPAGTETVLLATGGGAVVRGRYDDGRAAWGEPTTPGSGSSLVALSLSGETGYACDTNAGVFRTRDAGESWERVGVDDGAAFVGLAVDGEAPLVVADDGRAFRFDGHRWTPRRVADGPLSGLAVGAADAAGAGGEDGPFAVAPGPGGTLVERVAGDWERRLVATDVDLDGAAVGPDRAVVVGAEGTVLERRVG